jgi:GTP-binding protein HflX
LSSKHIDHAVPLIRASRHSPEARESSRSPRSVSKRPSAWPVALDLDVRAEEIAHPQGHARHPVRQPARSRSFAALVREAEAEAVVVDDHLTPVQQRNLEKAWECKVIDRTGLILEIFGRARPDQGRPAAGRAGPAGL